MAWTQSCVDGSWQRMQFACIDGYSSVSITLSTGSPQGYLLYTLLTLDCAARFKENLIITFAENTIINHQQKWWNNVQRGGQTPCELMQWQPYFQYHRWSLTYLVLKNTHVHTPWVCLHYGSKSDPSISGSIFSDLCSIDVHSDMEGGNFLGQAVPLGQFLHLAETHLPLD